MKVIEQAAECERLEPIASRLDVPYPSGEKLDAQDQIRGHALALARFVRRVEALVRYSENRPAQHPQCELRDLLRDLLHEESE